MDNTSSPLSSLPPSEDMSSELSSLDFSSSPESREERAASDPDWVPSDLSFAEPMFEARTRARAAPARLPSSPAVQQSPPAVQQSPPAVEQSPPAVHQSSPVHQPLEGREVFVPTGPQPFAPRRYELAADVPPVYRSGGPEPERGGSKKRKRGDDENEDGEEEEEAGHTRRRRDVSTSGADVDHRNDLNHQWAEVQKAWVEIGKARQEFNRSNLLLRDKWIQLRDLAKKLDRDYKNFEMDRRMLEYDKEVFRLRQSEAE